MYAPTSIIALAAFAQGIAAQSVAGFSAQAFSQLDSSRAGPEYDETPVVRYLFPPSRGASSLVSSVGPCQGYELGNRFPYPISGGDVSWAGLVSVYGLEFRYSTAQDPQSQGDFQFALGNLGLSLRGQQCRTGPDFEALGLNVGDNVTMQLYYEQGPQRRPSYECADLTLVSEEDFAEANYETSCVNHVLGTQDRRDAMSNPQIVELREAKIAEVREERAKIQAQYEHSQDGLTNVEAGVIGAMVTLAVFLIAGAVFWAVGRGRSGKKRAASLQTVDSLEKPSRV